MLLGVAVAVLALDITSKLLVVAKLSPTARSGCSAAS